MGLAVLCFPFTIAALLANFGPPRHAMQWIFFFGCITGSIGLYIGGIVAYSTTRLSGPLLERLILLTLIVTGLAFPIAAAPYFVFVAVGFVFAWALGAMIMAVPVLIIAAAWSLFYLTKLGPKPSQCRSSIGRAGAKSVLPVALMSALGLFHVVFSIWQSSGLSRIADGVSRFVK